MYRLVAFLYNRGITIEFQRVLTLAHVVVARSIPHVSYCKPMETRATFKADVGFFPGPI